MPGVAIYHYGGYSPPLYNIDSDLIVDYGDRLDDFLRNSTDYKLAIVEVNYHQPCLTVIELTKLLCCDKVIVKSMELENRIIDILNQFDLPNFTFVVNGALNQPLQHAQVDQEMFWMNSTAYPYQHEWIDYTHDNLKAFDIKPYMFDVLYGLEKPHRLFVKNQLQFLEKKWFYQTPFFVRGDKDNQFQNLNFDHKDLWEDQIEINQQWNYRCSYLNNDMHISQVLPFKIYSQTAYTLVLETWADNRFSFFTEKIAKPILAYRLFVVISGQHYLKNLRQLGFKTFDSILDESYDDETDDHVRWTKAIDQARWLCQQPQHEILSQIAPIVLHNYRVLMNLNYLKVTQHAESFLIQHGCHRCQ